MKNQFYLLRSFSIRLALSTIHVLAAGLVYAQEAADSSQQNCPPTSYGLKFVLDNVLCSYGEIANLLGSFGYITGVCFGIASAFKFKQHRDNPSQVTIGFPLAYLTTAVGLIFMSSVLREGGDTFFSSGVDSAYSNVYINPSVWTS